MKIFETNSSSSHAITLAKSKSKIDQTIEPENGVIEVMVGEYGWEVDSYYTPMEKASYIATAIMNYKKSVLPRFKRVIRKVTGAKKVIIPKLDGDFYEYGYIDHQSAPDKWGNPGWDKILNTDAGMEKFIFSSKSSFMTDNDNH